jgi:hypothetical protein
LGYQGVDDGFEGLLRLRVAENMPAHAFAVECAIWGDEFRPKDLGDDGHGRAMRRRDAASNRVSINHCRTTFLQYLTHSAFAAADAACESDAKC